MDGRRWLADLITRIAGAINNVKVKWRGFIVSMLATGSLALISGAVMMTWTESAMSENTALLGFEVAKIHCARCHVIGQYNRMGGIGNAPSFQAMANNEDYKERFSTFYARRPHPVFVRVPGYARWSNAAPYNPEFKISHEEIDQLAAYAASLHTKGE